MLTTRANIEQHLNADLSAVDSYVTKVINAVEQFIKNYTGKDFTAVAETRYYDGSGNDRLLIDSFYGTPTLVRILETDGTELLTLTQGQANDYIIYPLNSTEKNELVLTVGASIGYWPSGRRRVMVTATFGVSASVPADIEIVATELAAAILEKRIKGGVASSESLGDYSISFKDIEAEANLMRAENILDLHRDIAI